MGWLRSRTSSYVAAGLLALLTLTTFYLLRNYGPAWAIKRFHQAVAADDPLEIARVSVQRPDDKKLVQLEALVKGSQSFDIESVTQGPGEAVFTIRYYLRGAKVDVNWVVDQTKAGWLIDANKTLEQSPGLQS